MDEGFSLVGNVVLAYGFDSPVAQIAPLSDGVNPPRDRGVEKLESVADGRATAQNGAGPFARASASTRLRMMASTRSWAMQ